MDFSLHLSFSSISLLHVACYNSYCSCFQSSDFLKLSPPGWHAKFYLRVGILIWLSRFLGQFGQTKVLRTPKIMLFPVISGFLPRSESKWGLSCGGHARGSRATKGG
eukprot:sb/3477663/